MKKRDVAVGILIILILLLGAYALISNKEQNNTPIKKENSTNYCATNNCTQEQYSCPTQTLNCMPGPNTESRGQYCKWVQENCPDASIAY